MSADRGGDQDAPIEAFTTGRPPCLIEHCFTSNGLLTPAGLLHSTSAFDSPSGVLRTRARTMLWPWRSPYSGASVKSIVPVAMPSSLTTLRLTQVAARLWRTSPRLAAQYSARVASWARAVWPLAKPGAS